MRLFALLFLLTALPLATASTARAAEAATPAWEEADFEPISSGVATPARIAVRQDAQGLAVAVEIDAIVGCSEPPVVVLGAAAVSQQILTSKGPVRGAAAGRFRFAFLFPGTTLAKSDAEWAKLRFAASATFPGTINGQPLYRVRYRHQDGRALHDELSKNPQDWQAFDLNAYRLRASDRRARVALTFDQPLNGKATIAIDDANGRRVRNLIGGQPLAKGKQTVEWDLLDDDGKVVPPGDYTWRSLHHAGITPDYQYSFCNDGAPPWKTGSGTDMWGPDHSCITAVCAVGELVHFLSPCAEAGYQGAITDLQGVKKKTWGTPTAPSHFLMVTNGTEFYTAADDGQRQLIIRFKPGGEPVPFGNGQKEIEWGKAAMDGFGVSDSRYSQAHWDTFNLAGFALWGDRLVVASRAEKALLVFDAVSGAKMATIPLADPGTLVGLSDGSLLAVSGGAIVRFAARSDKPAPFLAAGRLKPGAMAAGPDGKLYVIDQATSQIVILDAANGKETGRLGKPGGAYAGKYDAERMVRPLTLALAANGWLWVTENRFNPKRVLAWDVKSGKVVREKFGSTSYGASGGGLDSADASRAIGQGAVWKLDPAHKTAVPSSVLFADAAVMPDGMHWRFLRRDGRTFLLGYGSCNSLVELLPDGSGRLLAQYGTSLGYASSLGKRLPPVFLETFYKERGFDTPEKRKRLPEERLPPLFDMFVWSDIDGDGQMEAEELQFSGRFGGGYWGADSESLDIVMPLFQESSQPLNWRLDMPLLGWYPSGAPKWKPLADAQSAAQPTVPAHWGNESSLSDRNGVMFLNAVDNLKCFGPDLKLRWTYPNKWMGVHGSHGAPLPSIGQIQGALFFLGNAPLDDGKTDVFVLNGNHGRFFALTSDGMYLDEFFKDVRMGSMVDAYLIGGECFGGSFVRGSDKVYRLLSGHTDYRLFTLRGFDTITRGPGGRLAVTAVQIDAADRRSQAIVASHAEPRSAGIPKLAAPPALDNSGTGWPKEPVAKWDKSGLFPVSVQAGWDATSLYVRWSVEEESPWSNHGTDDKLLFKTGDSVDLQLGTDPAALANRIAPVPGDLRVLIAPFKDKPIAMLYRHRVPGAKTPVPFSSPWRTENVDVVQRLTNARINVWAGRTYTNRGAYTVEAAIPLADLGLKPEPGRDFRADFGAIFGDPDGQMNQLRSYWANQATGLVNDVPGEIMLSPNAWGTVRFLEATK